MRFGTRRAPVVDKRRRPRLTCVIDALEQGGAQRQLSMLAALLTRRGWHVDVVTYRRTRFFDAVLEASGVAVHCLPESGRLRRSLAIRRAIRDRDPDAVVAYLEGPAAYAELAGLPRRRFRLIVTEFVVPGGTVRRADRLRLAAHRLADVVVTETDHVRRLVTAAVPGLADRMVVIRNGVDLRQFQPRNGQGGPEPASGGPAGTRVLVLAGYRLQKNPWGVLAAMEHLRRIARPASGSTSIGTGRRVAPALVPSTSSCAGRCAHGASTASSGCAKPCSTRLRSTGARRWSACRRSGRGART